MSPQPFADPFADRFACRFGIGLALLLTLASSGSATPTDPFLALRAATVLASSSPLLRVEGSFHAEDLAQVPFPLQILVRNIVDAGRAIRRGKRGVARERSQSGKGTKPSRARSRSGCRRRWS